MSAAQQPTAQPHRPQNLIIRTAIAIEATYNIIGALAMFLYPSFILDLASPNLPSIDAAITHPASILPSSTSFQALTLLHWLSAITLGLTPPLLLGLTETPWAIASRRIVYVTIGSVELALIGTALFQLGFGGSEAELGFSRKGLWAAVIGTMPLCAWRGFCLVGRPEWFGDGGLLVGGGGGAKGVIGKGRKMKNR